MLLLVFTNKYLQVPRSVHRKSTLTRIYACLKSIMVLSINESATAALGKVEDNQRSDLRKLIHNMLKEMHI